MCIYIYIYTHAHTYTCVEGRTPLHRALAMAQATKQLDQKNVFSISKPPIKRNTSFLFKNKVLSKQDLVFE